MSVADEASAILSLAENGLPAQSLAAMRDEVDQVESQIQGLVGETQNDYIMGAYHQLSTAKEDIDRARAAIEGVRESLNSYARWLFGGG
ncbi:hypothetical protein AB0M36_04520 [Actinoplanes sp. NPDC051346]|uniref:hypothetical protein n=1 Tax=Actinoplanes sp. NPDC051346 TaxID=3155048 RepID=UPI003449B680